MNTYPVTIQETLKMTVEVEAESREKAEALVKRHWKNGDYILDADAFAGVTFMVEEPQTRMVDMTYGTMRSYFRAAENSGQHLTGYIVFTQDSFTTEYSERSRTYTLSSNNKAFQPNKGGYSIFASCLDGTDPCLRLEGNMRDERGGKNGWKIERCYMEAGEAERGKALLRKEQDRER